MNINRNLTAAMIGAAIDKGIREIEAGTVPANISIPTPHYKILKHLVHTVDHEIIKTFGTNLGYHCWTYGAQIIRSNEKQYGFKSPWTIVFDLRAETETMLTTQEIAKVLNVGESLGIYSAMFIAGPSESRLETLVNKLTSHFESAFIIFTPPEIIAAKIATAFARARNIVPVLSLNSADEYNACIDASHNLLEQRCPYGTYTFALSSQFVSWAAAIKCAFSVLVRKSLANAARSGDGYPFLLVDFYADLARISRAISLADCFLSINASGQVAVGILDGLQDGLNIRTHSLQSILEKTMR